MTNQPKRVAVLYLAAVFLAGSVFGAAFYRFYAAEFASARESQPDSASQFRQKLIAKLTQQLALRPDQVEQLNLILDETEERFKEFRTEIEPGFDAIRAERSRHIMGILDAGQKPAYQKILDERQRKREEKNRLEQLNLKDKMKDGCRP
jgi:hypothetical protein